VRDGAHREERRDEPGKGHREQLDLDGLQAAGLAVDELDLDRAEVGREDRCRARDREQFLAGLVAALTPVAVLIFRYDNPDALLTFLLVSGAWALGRGLEAGRLRWALLAAVFVGLAFLTKYLQAYVVLPAFALTWLLFTLPV
jgi:hypothetical protein